MRHWKGEVFGSTLALLREYLVMASVILEDVPDSLHSSFKRRAERNQRSLQAEILSLMESANFEFDDEEKLQAKDLFGILQHDGPAYSVEEMDASVDQMFRETRK